MIAIIDYGLGNVRAFANIYGRLGIPHVVAAGPADLRGADRFVLPGVGAFDWAMARLTESGMRGPLEERVLGAGRPVLGICVGMQMLAASSEEGRLAGLGWIDARVLKFAPPPGAAPLQLPHMGWNDVQPVGATGLFRQIEAGRFYFLHSYYVAPAAQADVLATTAYHGTFAAAVRHGNVFGVQFHPEKSHGWGIQLLRNFAECDLTDAQA